MRRIALCGFVLAILLSAQSQSHAWYKPSKAHEDAVARVMTDPNGAEALLHETPNGTEKLDYALFLHAFKSPAPERDARIQQLLAEIDKAVDTSGHDTVWARHFTSRPYDGSDSSLVTHIQRASVSGVADFGNPGYMIPCGFLQKRPSLLEATSPQFGSSADASLPHSGCGLRGDVSGFPNAPIQGYARLARYVGDSENGTIRFSYEGIHALTMGRIKLDPRYFLAASYRDCSNHRVKDSVRPSFEAAQTALTNYYIKLGLTEKQATRAATLGLLAIPAPSHC
jgi:hypothetical protein